MSDLNKFQKGLMITLYILTALALGVSIFVIYQLVVYTKPETLGTVYANTLSVNDNDINIVEVKIFSNKNNNGQAVYEIQYNGYVDYQGGAIKGFGMQSNTKDNYSAQTIYQTNSGEIVTTYLGGIQLYNTDDLSKSSYVVNEMPTELYIDIDGAFYKIVFEQFEYERFSTNGWDAWNRFWGITTTDIMSYNYYSIFDYIIETAMSDSAKYDNGEFSIPLLDLSKYIKFYYQAEDTQYHPLDEASTMYEFLKIHITYSDDGMTSAQQSMFKQYYGNSDWSFYSDTDVEDYWNAYSDITITEKHLNAVYNELENAYYVTLDREFANYLNTLQMSEITVNLNLDNLDYAIYGIDLQNFDFNMESLTISSNEISELEIYNQEDCSVDITLNLAGGVVWQRNIIYKLQ